MLLLVVVTQWAAFLVPRQAQIMRQALLLCVLVVSLGLVSAFLSPHQPRSGERSLSKVAHPFILVMMKDTL